MRKIILYILIGITTIFTGCSDEDSNENVLRIESANVDIAARGGEGTIQISATATVEAYSGKEWLTINKSGISTSVVPFIVTENTSLMSRTAEIKITLGSRIETVNVTQAGAVFALETTNIKIGEYAEETFITFDLNNNELPRATVTDSWLKVTVDEGRLILLPTANIGLVRSTIVTITTSWKTVKLTVTQDNIKFVQQNDITIFRSGIESSAIVKGNDLLAGSSGWNVSSRNSWLSAVVDYGNNQIAISSEINTSGNARIGYVDVIVNGQVVDVVTVTQELYSYDYYLGDWQLSHYFGLQTVTLTEKVRGESYLWKYLFTDETGNHEFNITVGYWPNTGNLSMDSQFVGYYGNYQVYMCVTDWATNGGISFFDLVPGFDLVFNRSESDPAFTIQDSGTYTGYGYKLDSFMFILFDGEPSEKTLVDWLHAFFYLDSLTR